MERDCHQHALLLQPAGIHTLRRVGGRRQDRAAVETLSAPLTPVSQTTGRPPASISQSSETHPQLLDLPALGPEENDDVRRLEPAVVSGPMCAPGGPRGTTRRGRSGIAHTVVARCGGHRVADPRRGDACWRTAAAEGARKAHPRPGASALRLFTKCAWMPAGGSCGASRAATRPPGQESKRHLRPGPSARGFIWHLEVGSLQ